MHPSFGAPWPRLERAAARLTELPAAAGHGRLHAVLFLCGLKYLLTYREANGRRLSHYLDDGLREAVDQTLPALMKHCGVFQAPQVPAARVPRCKINVEFQRLVFAFDRLQRRLPAFTAKWVEHGKREANIVRLSFGMGVAGRFAPDSHMFVRRLLDGPLVLNTAVLDVLESFRWHPDWSLALAR